MTDPIVYNITIHPGEDYQMDIVYADDDGTPVDMSGWGITAQLREFPEASDYIDFACQAESEKMTIAMSNQLTRSISYTFGYYDIFITSPAPEYVKTRLIGGKALIVPRITR